MKRTRWHAYALRTLALASIICVVGALPAPAAPGTPRFGPVIDRFAPWKGQKKCAPKPKPGIRAFRRLVLTAYPTTRGPLTRRSCAGGQSEHYDGRAWDWMVNARRPKQKAKAEALIDWLLKTDQFGHKHANTRRLGIMYFIWNRRWWNSWEKRWQPYSGYSPHTDHIHFSFSWKGAYKKVTFWHPSRSTVNALDARAEKPGYWMTSGEGRVKARGAAEPLGSLRGWQRSAVVGLAATSSGKGYRLIHRDGNIDSIGRARDLKRIRAETEIVDATSVPHGGLWAVGRNGRVSARAGAEHFGDLRDRDVKVAGIAANPAGTGYWLVTRDGHVFAFGSARNRGGAVEEGIVAADIEASPGGGYWIVTTKGKIFARGAASHRGEITRLRRARIVQMQSTATGKGYWLLDAFGRTRAFGDAPPVGSW